MNEVSFLDASTHLDKRLRPSVRMCPSVYSVSMAAKKKDPPPYHTTSIDALPLSQPPLSLRTRRCWYWNLIPPCDPSLNSFRSVRLQAASALGQLVVIHQRVDPLFNDLITNIKSAEDSGVKDTTLQVCQSCVPQDKSLKKIPNVKFKPYYNGFLGTSHSLV